jgi:hypothetical protein
MTPHGRKVMNDSTKQMNDIMARYLVQGSMMWWVLCPVQWLWRRISKQATSAPVASPQHMVQDVRKASRENVPESMSWRTLGDSLQTIPNGHELQTN